MVGCDAGTVQSSAVSNKQNKTSFVSSTVTEETLEEVWIGNTSLSVLLNLQMALFISRSHAKLVFLPSKRRRHMCTVYHTLYINIYSLYIIQ